MRPRCRAFGVLDQFELAPLADEGHRREGRQRFGQHHRARTRTTAAMRGGEGLVQVDVHGVDAEIARPHDAHDGVEVGAIAVEVGAGLVHRLGDLDHLRLEQAAGVGVGQHDRRDVGTERGLHGFDIDGAVVAGGDRV